LHYSTNSQTLVDLIFDWRLLSCSRLMLDSFAPPPKFGSERGRGKRGAATETKWILAMYVLCCIYQLQPLPQFSALYISACFIIARASPVVTRGCKVPWMLWRKLLRAPWTASGTAHYSRGNLVIELLLKVQLLVVIRRRLLVRRRTPLLSCRESISWLVLAVWFGGGTS